MRTRQKNPLEPIARVADVLFALCVAGLGTAVLGGLAVLGGASFRVMGVGRSQLCVDSTLVQGGVTQSMFPAGVSGSAEVANVCVKDPDGFQMLLALFTRIPSVVLLIGSLWAIRRITRYAMRDGVYSGRMVGWVRWLGWWLTAGSLVAVIVRAIAEASLIAAVVPESRAEPLTVMLDEFPGVVFLTGLGVLTVARIMRVGADMREDLEGTV